MAPVKRAKTHKATKSTLASQCHALGTGVSKPYRPKDLSAFKASMGRRLARKAAATSKTSPAMRYGRPSSSVRDIMKGFGFVSAATPKATDAWYADEEKLQGAVDKLGDKTRHTRSTLRMDEPFAHADFRKDIKTKPFEDMDDEASDDDDGRGQSADGDEGEDVRGLNDDDDHDGAEAEEGEEAEEPVASEAAEDGSDGGDVGSQASKVYDEDLRSDDEGSGEDELSERDAKGRGSAGESDEEKESEGDSTEGESGEDSMNSKVDDAKKDVKGDRAAAKTAATKKKVRWSFILEVQHEDDGSADSTEAQSQEALDQGADKMDIDDGEEASTDTRSIINGMDGAAPAALRGQPQSSSTAHLQRPTTLEPSTHETIQTLTPEWIVTMFNAIRFPALKIAVFHAAFPRFSNQHHETFLKEAEGDLLLCWAFHKTIGKEQPLMPIFQAMTTVEPDWPNVKLRMLHAKDLVQQPKPDGTVVNPHRAPLYVPAVLISIDPDSASYKRGGALLRVGHYYPQEADGRQYDAYAEDIMVCDPLHCRQCNIIVPDRSIDLQGKPFVHRSDLLEDIRDMGAPTLVYNGRSTPQGFRMQHATAIKVQTIVFHGDRQGEAAVCNPAACAVCRARALPDGKWWQPE